MRQDDRVGPDALGGPGGRAHRRKRPCRPRGAPRGPPPTSPEQVALADDPPRPDGRERAGDGARPERHHGCGGGRGGHVVRRPPRRPARRGPTPRPVRNRLPRRSGRAHHGALDRSDHRPPFPWRPSDDGDLYLVDGFRVRDTAAGSSSLKVGDLVAVRGSTGSDGRWRPQRSWRPVRRDRGGGPPADWHRRPSGSGAPPSGPGSAG